VRHGTLLGARSMRGERAALSYSEHLIAERACLRAQASEQKQAAREEEAEFPVAGFIPIIAQHGARASGPFRRREYLC
jgi:hypothetical protein